MSKFVAFLKNDSGATAIEYGLIAAGISVAIIAVVFGLGTGLNKTFTSVTTMKTASANNSPPASSASTCTKCARGWRRRGWSMSIDRKMPRLHR